MGNRADPFSIPPDLLGVQMPERWSRCSARVSVGVVVVSVHLWKQHKGDDVWKHPSLVVHALDVDPRRGGALKGCGRVNCALSYSGAEELTC